MEPNLWAILETAEAHNHNPYCITIRLPDMERNLWAILETARDPGRGSYIDRGKGKGRGS